MYSTNVGLEHADDAPLQEVAQLYGDGDGLLTALRECLARWNSTVTPPDELLPLLHCVRKYTALGGLSRDERFVQDMLSVALNSIVRRALKFEVCANNNNGSDENDWDDEEEAVTNAAVMRQIIVVASAAISNCCGGTTRHNADMLLWVKMNGEVLRVVFGFADYAEGETGARLWAGAVALSLYTLEHMHEMLLLPIPSTIPSKEAYCPLRVIEIGCGPALVSLVFARCLMRYQQLLQYTRLDVTDISPAVVAEVQQSFATRNGPEMAALLTENIKVSQDAATAGVAIVRTFCLDFSDIPAEISQQYDVVLGSDIVYDHDIAALVAPALLQLLRPGGVAFICCERHRDGMVSFVDNIRTRMEDSLEVLANHADVQTELQQLNMIPGLTTTACSLVILRRRSCKID
ncbi:Lysine methyltransferase [Trypanosoma melophagium]|uniref:Lysine methyltransferase n=1 Tax=Trypanosoma melophagium TaxID=715481 RepID=UPI00351A3EB3|nr:Lysine methyltransferase [Trypanosoma melophagium]